MKLNQDYQIQVTDNASSDQTLNIIQEKYSKLINIRKNNLNLGFAAAHNQGVADFIKSQAANFLVLNPDLVLEKDTLFNFKNLVANNPQIGLFTPKILRATQDLRPINPAVIDACGMELNSSIRHLDRGSGQLDIGQFESQEIVFGGTGAALLVTRQCLLNLVLTSEQFDSDIARVYPFLLENKNQRLELFDEAFFAYREDADLCWRAQILNWKCLYSPSVVLYHRRKVLPELRSELEPEINAYGVRNRFLLQLNNFSFVKNWSQIFRGLILRNLTVILAVVFFERSSFNGLIEASKLSRRALARRKSLYVKANKRKLKNII